jgi:hypothetical protein
MSSLVAGRIQAAGATVTSSSRASAVGS